MTSVYVAREASRNLLLKCCTVHSPTSWHRKVVRCLTQIYSSLDRVQKFTPFLLNCTASTLDALNTTLEFVSHLSSIQEPCSEEDEQELCEILAKLWELYMDLDDGLKLQEVTTPSPRLLPKLKCHSSNDSPRVKSPLGRSSSMRSPFTGSKDLGSV